MFTGTKKDVRWCIWLPVTPSELIDYWFNSMFSSDMIHSFSCSFFSCLNQLYFLFYFGNQVCLCVSVCFVSCLISSCPTFIFCSLPWPAVWGTVWYLPYPRSSNMIPVAACHYLNWPISFDVKKIEGWLKLEVGNSLVRLYGWFPVVSSVLSFWALFHWLLFKEPNVKGCWWDNTLLQSHKVSRRRGWRTQQHTDPTS